MSIIIQYITTSPLLLSTSHNVYTCHSPKYHYIIVTVVYLVYCCIIAVRVSWFCAKKSPTGSLPPAVPLAIKRTFRPWTHTSDDSYIYQLSLVVATATLYLFKAGPVHGKFAREDDVVFGKPVTKKFRPGVVYSRSSLIFLCVPPHETRDEHRV